MTREIKYRGALPQVSIELLKKAEHEANMKKLLGSVVESGGLPGKAWVEAHWNDVTQADIDRQVLQVNCSGITKNIPSTLKKKDMRVLLKSIRR